MATVAALEPGGVGLLGCCYGEMIFLGVDTGPEQIWMHGESWGIDLPVHCGSVV